MHETVLLLPRRRGSPGGARRAHVGDLPASHGFARAVRRPPRPQRPTALGSWQEGRALLRRRRTGRVHPPGGVPRGWRRRAALPPRGAVRAALSGRRGPGAGSLGAFLSMAEALEPSPFGVATADGVQLAGEEVGE